MQTPGIFSGYNQIMTPYYFNQQKNFPSISKIGLGTLTDIDKMDGGENNNFLNMMNGNY